MSKVIDVNKNIYEVVKEYPEVKDIMAELGFSDIVKSIKLNFLGKHISIKKGSVIKKIPLDKVIKSFEDHGYEVVDSEFKKADVIENPKTNEELLKSYIQRLNNGEDLSQVREEFVNNFESVSVHDIINIEQGMIREGTPVEEVQKLCDLHSALFHGRTEAEIYFEEEQIQNSLDEPGHPINIFKAENRALEIIVNDLEDALNNDNFELIKEVLSKLKKIRILYGKKEELILPVLYRYEVKGPSDVMWGVDDEIKAEYSRLAKEVTIDNYPDYKIDIQNVVARTKEMIYKEENILFPLAIDKFTIDDWISVYEDLPEMGVVFTDTYPSWDYADTKIKERLENQVQEEGFINLDGGKLTVKELNAIFRLLPIDITFIDIEANNQFFTNEGKIFSRPKSALGRKVFECHPPRMAGAVEKIINDFKTSKRDKIEIWTPSSSNPIKVTYLAVRDNDNNYIGTVEFVQQFKDDIAHLKESLK